jgi:hypothetical protein
VAATLAAGLAGGCSNWNADNSTGGTPPGPTPPPPPPVGIFTYHNDNARTGQYLDEVLLTPANVDATGFGKLAAFAVDGQIYAQPLYMRNVTIGGQSYNVVFVATEHDSVYAFDANGASGAVPLWHTSFIDPGAGVTTVPSDDVACDNLVPEIGITSTPVIDPAHGTLYVVAKTKENGNYFFRLHALDVATGAQKLSPRVIAPSAPGSAAPNDGHGHVGFEALVEHQRAALLLDNGILYIGFASHCDNGDYHGWLVAYDAGTLEPRAALNVTPDGTYGGIWQSGAGPSADGHGSVYAITGNGTFDAATGGRNYGDSFLRLDGATLAVTDYFTPYNQAYLEALDQDLGSGPALLLPDQATGPPHLLVSAGKEGTIYLVDRDHMGHYRASDDGQIVQSLPLAISGLYGAPAYYAGTLYFAGANDALKAFVLSDGRFASATPSAQSPTTYGYPGATPAISANGSDRSSAIVWTLQTDQFETNGPAVLHAYSALDVSTELYRSDENPARDDPGPAVKFTVPTVADGKVYVGTQTQLSVFGQLP